MISFFKLHINVGSKFHGYVKQNWIKKDSETEQCGQSKLFLDKSFHGYGKIFDLLESTED